MKNGGGDRYAVVVKKQRILEKNFGMKRFGQAREKQKTEKEKGTNRSYQRVRKWKSS